ncbi:MAG: FHA domain-containing protein [Rhodospirillaceae bacterium]|jgi:pSer/pThr/pTyr-binding forkhead associated (FHA) protein|nr:FHA domain-containing protein [Rhodospirillaceae bacterium]
MAKMVLSMNGAIQGEFPLEKERHSIGRKPDNDIQIDNLAVSGKHALIITILDDSFLEDLGSTNGTYVNGKLVKKHALRNGDVIGLGKHELKYVNDHATADDEEFEKTMIIRPGSASAAVAAAKAAEQAAPPPAPAAEAGAKPAAPAAGGGMPLGKLQVLNGPIAGKELELTKALITLGKPGTQVAVISRRPQGYFLTHIEGDGQNDNFPVVNGAPIGPQAYAIQNGDIIELAGIKMEFNLVVR